MSLNLMWLQDIFPRGLFTQETLNTFTSYLLNRCGILKLEIISISTYSFEHPYFLSAFLVSSFFLPSVNLRQQQSTGSTQRCILVPSLHSPWVVQLLTAGQNVFLTRPVTSLMSLFLYAEVSQKMLKYPKVSNKVCLLFSDKTFILCS